MFSRYFWDVFVYLFFVNFDGGYVVIRFCFRVVVVIFKGFIVGGGGIFIIRYRNR